MYGSQGENKPYMGCGYLQNSRENTDVSGILKTHLHFIITIHYLQYDAYNNLTNSTLITVNYSQYIT